VRLRWHKLHRTGEVAAAYPVPEQPADGEQQPALTRS
jgi:hypothetical protein